MSAPGWPAQLVSGRVAVEPLHRGDARAWSAARLTNEHWVSQWEPAGVGRYADRNSVPAFREYRRRLAKLARQGTHLPFAVFADGRLVGQVAVSNIVRGAFNSGALSYWIAESAAGQGLTPTAVALLVDHCFGPVQLHRVEANIRPENVASRRVVEKLGFRFEGTHLRYLAIDGAYRDHLSYAVTTEDIPGGLCARWETSQLTLRDT